jgi:hypothetical protein
VQRKRYIAILAGSPCLQRWISQIIVRLYAWSSAVAQWKQLLPTDIVRLPLTAKETDRCQASTTASQKWLSNTARKKRKVDNHKNYRAFNLDPIKIEF